MKSITCLIVLCLLYLKQFGAETLIDYAQRRANLLAADAQLSFGSKTFLSGRELLVNDVIKLWKNKATDSSANNQHYVNFSTPYFKYRNAMRRSKLYQLIRKMPKGAALHIHSSLMFHPDDLIKYTYHDKLYICLTDDILKFRFSTVSPRQYCPVDWVLIRDVRMTHPNVTDFDAMLKERLTLGPEDFPEPVTDTNEAWAKFKKTTSTILSLVEYRPLREKLIYQSLQNLYNDNIRYVEFRLGLYYFYELNGIEHDKLYSAILHNQVATKFMREHRDFVGVKFIVSGSRRSDVYQVRDDLNLARKVKEILPKAFAGFDLVGQEDAGNSLQELLPVLLEAKDEMDFYFHAGETSSFGTSVDENLFDAILLGTKRIGHGLALIKHPALIQAVHEKDIAVEVNVISNSVLSLVKDLRNHPLATFLAVGLPLVISSDDPGMWGAAPLTDDFYVAFVAVASKHADLRMLKQLAINSIRYSALDDGGKTKLFKIFEKKWNQFIEDVIERESNFFA